MVADGDDVVDEVVVLDRVVVKEEEDGRDLENTVADVLVRDVDVVTVIEWNTLEAALELTVVGTDESVPPAVSETPPMTTAGHSLEPEERPLPF